MLTDWKFIALFAPLFFALYQALSKFLPKTVSIFLVNAYASLIGAVIMLIIHLLVSENKSLALNNRNLFLALGIGALISIGNFLVIKAFNLGAQQSLFASLFYPVLIGYSVLIGLFIWHEKLNAPQMLGVALSVIGIILIAYFRK